MYQNRPSDAASLSSSFASPWRTSQSSATRRLSWSASRRSSQTAWSAPAEPCLSRLGEPQEVERMQAPPFRIGGRQFFRVLADDLEEPVPAARGLHDARRDERVELLDGGLGAADVEHCLGREPTVEDRQPAEQPPLRRIEQLDAPVDRRAHGPMAGRRITRPAGEGVEARIEQTQQLARCERAEPRRRQFDCERQPLRAARRSRETRSRGGRPRRPPWRPARRAVRALPGRRVARRRRPAPLRAAGPVCSSPAR